MPPDVSAPPIDLGSIHLDKGGHTDFEAGHCLLEVVAAYAGRGHTDRPPCVSDVLGDFGRSLNDVLPDEKRQRLTPFVPRLPGTTGDGLDETRGYLALDWLIRVWTPAWLRLVPALTADADVLAGYRPIRTLDDAAGIGDAVRTAASHSAAARDAARDAAWAAARDAARAAARDAARDAARAALAPTVEALQDSAVDLFDRMITGVSR